MLTNVNDVIRMQKEQSITYESLPGFIAKYRVERDLGLTLLEANSRFMEYFDEGAGSGHILHQRNIEDNLTVLMENRDRLLSGEPVQFVMNVKSRQGKTCLLYTSIIHPQDWQRFYEANTEPYDYSRVNYHSVEYRAQNPVSYTHLDVYKRQILA